jgi:hypothetical protein
METELEQNVREIFVEDDASYDTSEAVPRILAIDFRHRVSRRRRVWAMLGTSGTAVAGGIVAAVLLLSSGVAPAYAGWASVPAQPTARAVAAASKACNTGYTSYVNDQPQNTDFFTGQPVLTEARGIFTAVVSVTDGRLYECLEGGNQENVHADFNFSVHQFGKVGTPLTPDQLSVPYTFRSGIGAGRNPEESQWPRGRSPGPNATPSQVQEWRLRMRARLSGGGYGPSVLGQAGTDVSAVSFAFANGDTVTATVQNGWYFAWWPWLSAPTSVTVTTSSGTESSPVTGSGSPRQPVVPGCQSGTGGCVFADTRASSS